MMSCSLTFFDNSPAAIGRGTWNAFVTLWAMVWAGSLFAQSLPDYPGSLQASSSGFRNADSSRLQQTPQLASSPARQNGPTGGSDQWATQQAPIFSSSRSSGVVTASAEQPLPQAKVASPSGYVDASPLTPLQPPTSESRKTKARSGSSMQMFVSVGSSLLIVIGLFVGCAWVYRKSIGTQSRNGLPNHVVQVLGRTPVAPRQHLVLLRFGSKLVLASMVQGEMRAISEITDPVEVDQLAGLCESTRSSSITASFREILAQGGRA